MERGLCTDRGAVDAVQLVVLEVYFGWPGQELVELLQVLVGFWP